MALKPKGEEMASAFNEWWQKEEDLMRQQGADDEVVLRAMRSIAEMAWSASRRELYPYEEAQCYCGDIYSPDMNLNACIVIQETGYCPNCIAMEMREYKKMNTYKKHQRIDLERAVTRDGREVPMSKANDWVRLFRVAPYGQVVVMLTRDDDRNSVIKFIYKDTKDHEYSYECSFNVFDIYEEEEGKEFLQKSLSMLSDEDIKEVLDILSSYAQRKGLAALKAEKRARRGDCNLLTLNIMGAWVEEMKND